LISFSDWMLRRRARQPLGRKYLTTLSPSVLNSTRVPRCWRICRLVRLIMPWRLPAMAAFTRPPDVILKRFLAPDLVLILGILLSFGAASDARPCGRSRRIGSKRAR